MNTRPAYLYRKSTHTRPSLLSHCISTSFRNASTARVPKLVLLRTSPDRKAGSHLLTICPSARISHHSIQPHTLYCTPNGFPFGLMRVCVSPYSVYPPVTHNTLSAAYMLHATYYMLSRNTYGTSLPSSPSRPSTTIALITSLASHSSVDLTSRPA